MHLPIKMGFTPVVTVLMAAMIFIAPAHAKNNIVTEADIIRAAMTAGADYQAILRDEVADKADADLESTLSNPTIDMAATRTSAAGDDSNAYEIEIEQPLKLSQLSGARRSLTRALYDRAEIRRQHGLLQAYWNAKTLYAQAWQYQQYAILYADFQKQARDVSSVVGQSVKAGQTPVREGSLFAGDVAKFAGDLAKVKADQASVLLQLEKATGLHLRGKTLAKPVLDIVDGDIGFYERESYRNASLVRLLEADLNAAERQKNAAMADAMSAEIAPRIMYGRSRDNDEDSIGIGLVLSVPLWDRNQNERRKADAARVYARQQLDMLQVMPLSVRLERVIGAIHNLDERITLLQDDALPHYRTSFKQTQKSFSAGQADALALWQIRERLFETERDVLDAMIEAIEARRILSLETGMMPQEAI